MERHIEANKLYHRRCIREQQRSTLTKKPNQGKDLQKYAKADYSNLQNGVGKMKQSSEQNYSSPPKSSHNVFTNLHSVPKAYTSFAPSNNNQSEAISGVKPVVPQSSHLSKPLASNVNQNNRSPQMNNQQSFQNTTFQRRHYSNDENIQPMETETYKVGTVNSEPQVAHSKLKPAVPQAQFKSGPKSSNEEAQMKQGLLKTLLGLQATRKDATPGGAGEHTTTTSGSSDNKETPSSNHGAMKPASGN